MTRTLVIVNPAAGGGRAEKIWPRLESRLREAIGPFETLKTHRRSDATEFAKSTGYERVVACGGDGTIHEVANGLIQQKRPPTLGILSLGTGSDLIKSLKIPSNLVLQVEILRRGRSRPMDVGEIEFSGDGKREKRCFLNIVDAGMGAEVLRRLGVSRSLFGRRLAYFLATLEAYRGRRPVATSVTVDQKKVWEEPTLLAVVANGKSFGGGMQIAPHAEVSDGELEIVLVRDLTPPWLPLAIPLLYLKQVRRLPQVRLFKGRQVSLESEGPSFLDIDGELVGSLPVKIRILPAGLMVIA